MAAPAEHAALMAGTGPAGRRALAREIAAAYGNLHAQRVARAVLARDETATEATLVQQLDDELDDTFVDEELCISLIQRMSATERASITTDAYRDKLASALDEDEMLQVVRLLNPPRLATKLEWIRAGTWLSAWEIDWEDIKPLIVAAPPTERETLRTDAWKAFFVSVCGNDEMAEAVILIGGTQEQKQAWLDEEGTTTDEYLNALVRMQVFETGADTAHDAPATPTRRSRSHLGELVKNARADGRQIAGMVAVVGDEDFNAAGINHYGADVWATKSLAGFVDSERPRVDPQGQRQRRDDDPRGPAQVVQGRRAGPQPAAQRGRHGVLHAQGLRGAHAAGRGRADELPAQLDRHHEPRRRSSARRRSPPRTSTATPTRSRPPTWARRATTTGPRSSPRPSRTTGPPRRRW